MKLTALLTHLAAGALLLTLSSPADAAAYIKFDGIDGECTDREHTGWINLLSVSHSVKRVQPEAGSGRTGAAPVFSDIVVGIISDKATPKLLEAAATGQVVPIVRFDLARDTADGERQVYLKYELKNVLVTSYALGGETTAGRAPAQEIAFNFEEIKVTYVEFGSDGEQKGNVETTWKVEEGEK